MTGKFLAALEMAVIVVRLEVFISKESSARLVERM